MVHARRVCELGRASSLARTPARCPVIHGPDNLQVVQDVTILQYGGSPFVKRLINLTQGFCWAFIYLLEGEESKLPKLVLVKHAMPAIDTDKPAHEWQLSAAGRLQASRLADRLLPSNPHIIISSDEPKAQETAEIVGAQLGLTNQVTPGLHEHDRWGVPYLEKAKYHALVSVFFNNPAELVFGRETADEAYSRFSTALLAEIERLPDKNIVVVTHGTVISLFVARMIGIEPFALWSKLGLPSFVALNWPQRELVDIIEEMR